MKNTDRKTTEKYNLQFVHLLCPCGLEIWLRSSTLVVYKWVESCKFDRSHLKGVKEKAKIKVYVETRNVLIHVKVKN